jgi:thioesterase domain-containing protein
MMRDDSGCRDLENFLHAQIPITREMGVAVEESSQTRLVLTAPLELNHNHLGTAFGGSLSAIATLAGYGLLWNLLDDPGLHIVIRESSMRYLRPVKGEIRAICAAPEESAISSFRVALADRGKARISLRVTVEEEGEICMDFTGEYVALGEGRK